MVKKLQLKEADTVIDNDIDFETERSHDWALKNKDIAFNKVANILSNSLFVVNDEDDLLIFIDNVVDGLPESLNIYSNISPTEWTITFTKDKKFIAKPNSLNYCTVAVDDNHLATEAKALDKILRELTFWYGKEYK